MNKNKTLKLVELAIFIAIVLVVQLLGGAVKVGPISISLVLIPIVVGGMLLGPSGGAILGFTFGVATVIGGLTGADVFTATLFNAGALSALSTVLLCLFKATAAGWLSAVVFRALAKKNQYMAIFAAAITAPIVNTGLFILGALTILNGVISANFVAEGSSLLYFVFIGCAGVNFLIELLANIIFAPAIRQVLKAVSKGKLVSE